ncbi:MAG: hypothetical protein O2967_04945 [Proteobacteria bacterium]|nr:hypothetical protein [Pseudomonadota bacterium]
MIGRKFIFAALLAPWLLSLMPSIGRADGGVLPVADGSFLAGVEDLPLMPGLREIPEATMIFDKPAGRLVQAMAQGEGNQAALWQFYDETLPQLGWRRAASGYFVRDGEGLRISVEKHGATLTVRFAIAPISE